MADDAINSLWDLGRQAYRERVQLVDNPFLFSAPEVAPVWAQGWLHERAHQPRPEDAATADVDPDCISPWMGDDSGYGGYG